MHSMSTEEIILAVFYIVIFLLGLVGNSIVVYFFGFKLKKFSSFRWFVIQLAIVDAICCFVSPIQLLYTLFAFYEWKLGDVTCKLSALIGPVSVNVSSWILCAIAYERYRAIVHPLKERFSRRKINCICALIWLGSFGIFIPYSLSVKVENEVCISNWNSSAQELTMAVIILLIQSMVPISILLFFFLRIRISMKNKRRKSCENDKRDENLLAPKSVSLKTNIKARDKVTVNALLIAVVTFITCSLPYNMFYVISVYMIQYHYTMAEFNKFHSTYARLNLWLSLVLLSNSVMNYFIYAGNFRSFRRFVFRIFKRECSNNGDENSSLRNKIGEQSDLSALPLTASL